MFETANTDWNLFGGQKLIGESVKGLYDLASVRKAHLSFCSVMRTFCLAFVYPNKFCQARWSETLCERFVYTFLRPFSLLFDRSLPIAYKPVSLFVSRFIQRTVFFFMVINLYFWSGLESVWANSAFLSAHISFMYRLWPYNAQDQNIFCLLCSNYWSQVNWLGFSYQFIENRSVIFWIQISDCLHFSWVKKKKWKGMKCDWFCLTWDWEEEKQFSLREHAFTGLKFSSAAFIA